MISPHPITSFFVYKGGALATMAYVEFQHKCKLAFDVCSEKRRFIKELEFKLPDCSQETQEALEQEDPLRHTALMDALQVLARNAGPNWIRIDMYDTKHYKPVLGEFMPFSSRGNGKSLYSCV
jgi:hypothetical protein